jgi:modulator of FtsH protease
LPGRAAETLILPSGALVACSFALVPHQPGWVLAWEMGLTGIVVWASTIYLQIYAGRSDLPGVKAVHRFRLVLRVLLCQSSTLPFIVAGALFYAGDPAALYWIAGGVIASLIVAVLNAWVLLVEILR